MATANFISGEEVRIEAMDMFKVSLGVLSTSFKKNVIPIPRAVMGPFAKPLKENQSEKYPEGR